MTSSGKLDALSVVLPRGTRVTLRTTIASEGKEHAKGMAGVVDDTNGRRYRIRMLGGAFVDVGRDQIEPQSHAVLERIHDEQHAFANYRGDVILAVVVGSQAWGLADDESDDDVRGAFTWHFDDFTGLFRAPDEIHDPARDESFWEIEKLIRQGLRADPNTLETLWSPLLRESTALGDRLLSERDIFTSRLVVGSFGRYAQGQAKKLGAALLRADVLQTLIDRIRRGELVERKAAATFVDEFARAHGGETSLADLLRSARDRGLLSVAEFDEFRTIVLTDAGRDLEPRAVRPKNAYNLLRLLHSCLHWMREHQPMIEVPAHLRAELLDVKNGRKPMEFVLERAHTLGLEVEAAAITTTLPEIPNHTAAEEILRAARRDAAKVSVSVTPPPQHSSRHSSRHSDEPSPMRRNVAGKNLPNDVDTASVRSFFELYDFGNERTLPLVTVALTGAHAYGFPSPDSDLDLKAIHAVPASLAIARQPNFDAIESIEMYRGREFDFSSHDVALAVSLLLKGNGNMLERLLGPFTVVSTPLGEELATLAQKSLSQQLVHHYRGFFRGSVREYKREDEAGTRSVKRLLYAYRVALTGCHLLSTATMETDVRPLAETYGFPLVTEWIERKSEGERARITREEQAPVEDEIERLARILQDAFERSSLPSTCPNEAALDHFVVRARWAADRWQAGT